MIVKTEKYTREQVGKVVHLRSIVEGLKLGSGVLERLAAEGEKSSLRFRVFAISPFTSDKFSCSQICVTTAYPRLDTGEPCRANTDRS